jgi:hypothetical protein
MQRPGAMKRQKERGRQEKQREKEAAKAERRKQKPLTEQHDGEAPAGDPDIAGIVPGPQPPAST